MVNTSHKSKLLALDKSLASLYICALKIRCVSSITFQLALLCSDKPLWSGLGAELRLYYHVQSEQH
jgi:hypothetical protein